MKPLFFSARLYSVGFNVGIALVAVELVDSSSDIMVLLRACVASMVMWLFFNWTSDFVQRDDGKPLAPPLLRAALITGAIVLSPRVESALMLASYVAAIYLYACKARSSVVGPIGPLLRGVTLLCSILWLATFVHTFRLAVILEASFTWLLVTIVIRRNLVGDVRDMRGDKFELPVRVSWKVTAAVVGAVSLLSIVLSLYGGYNSLTLLVAVVAVALETYLISHRDAFDLAGLRAHRSLIVLDTLAASLIGYRLGAPILWVSVPIALTFAFMWTYRLVPGKSYGHL